MTPNRNFRAPESFMKITKFAAKAAGKTWADFVRDCLLNEANRILTSPPPEPEPLEQLEIDFNPPEPEPEQAEIEFDNNQNKIHIIDSNNKIVKTMDSGAARAEHELTEDQEPDGNQLIEEMLGTAPVGDYLYMICCDECGAMNDAESELPVKQMYCRICGKETTHKAGR